MSISYKTRKGLRRFGVVIGILALVAIVIYTGWVIWVGRYITYSREGAKLDLSISTQFPQGQAAVAPTDGEAIDIIYQEPVKDDENSLPIVEQTNIRGYYITADALADIPAILAQLEELPAGTAVMLEMKDIKGNFFYETTVGSQVSSQIDMAQMTSLLEFLHKNDLHAIAKIPAFRDREYGLNNVPQGLPRKGGKGSLWMDDEGCYWLNPANEEVLSYLMRIVMELKGLGFDEVAFTEFRFPDTEKIIFDGDKAQAIADAAQKLVTTCAVNRFFVSFYSSNYAFPLPSGNSRLYLRNIAAAEIPTVVSAAVTKNPKSQLMFITDVSDTRFDEYCVLRPLDSAQYIEE